MKSSKSRIPEMFKVKEVAKIFRVSPHMIRYLIRVGEMNAITLGRRTRIPRSEVEKVLGRSLETIDLDSLGITKRARKEKASFV